MTDFEPILSRNWNVPDSRSQHGSESRGDYQAARKAHTQGVPAAALTGPADPNSSTPDDSLEEACEESFPASDAPAWTHMRIGPPR